MGSKKDQWTAEGRCRWCGGEPEVLTLPDGSERKLRYCKAHRNYFRDYAARVRQESGGGVKRKCSICRTPGCNMSKHKQGQAR